MRFRIFEKSKVMYHSHNKTEWPFVRVVFAFATFSAWFDGWATVRAHKLTNRQTCLLRIAARRRMLGCLRGCVGAERACMCVRGDSSAHFGRLAALETHSGVGIVAKIKQQDENSQRMHVRVVICDQKSCCKGSHLLNLSRAHYISIQFVYRGESYN